MGCEGIPKYLHYSADKKKIYKPKSFRFYHILFRTGFKERDNPLEFPQTLTAYSVCWSKLIAPKDVLKTIRAVESSPGKLGNHTYFGRISHLKKICVSTNYDKEDDYSGEHTITTEIVHSPLECNYSHTEILIKHTFYNKGVKQVDVISYKDWNDNKCLLRKKSHKHFFKPLQNEYKVKLATALNSDINELNARWFSKIVPKNLVVRLSLWKAIVLNQNW